MAVLLFQGFTRKESTRPSEEVWTSPQGWLGSAGDNTSQADGIGRNAHGVVLAGR